MSSPKRHHIVPQCYLRKFSSDKLTVNYYDKLLNTYCNDNIDKICQIEDFYTLSQSEPYLIETKFFANDIEDKLARILTHFENIDCNLSTIHYDKTHRYNLSKQIVLQYMRTPLYRDTKSQNELETYYDKIKQILNKIKFEVEEIEFRPNNKAEFHKTILLEDISNVISIIAEANWELIYTSTEEFYTSDNPVTIKIDEDSIIEYYEAIEHFEEIFYPLNSHLALHISNRLNKSFKCIPIRKSNDLETRNINSLIRKNAVRYIIYQNE